MRFKTAADRLFIEKPVGLPARRPDGGTLAAIQDTKLDARFIGGNRHGAAKRVDLFDEVSLADPADRRIARHLAQCFDAVREQERLAPHSRAGERSFGAGVAAADDDDIKFLT